MSRCVLLAVLLVWGIGPLAAQAQKETPAAPPPKQDELKTRGAKPVTSEEEEVPPEEDNSVAGTEYSFNPLQAEKDLQTGSYYWRKGSYRAAAMRFRDATKWNDGLSEAWLRLGEAEEKLKDPKAAHEAYAKYLALAPDAKNASEIRKKLGKLKAK